MFHNAFKHQAVVRVACLAVGLFISAAAAAKEELPEVDSDGLHLIKNSKVRIAYAKPGAQLSQYSKVMILDCFVQFKENWERDYNLDQVGLSGRVTDKDEDRIKSELAAEFKKVMTETLTKNGHEVVDAVGADVVLLRPAIINLDVAAPDMMRSSRGNTWVSSAGEMTLYMELYDSGSNVLIGRVIDPQADSNMGAQMASKVSNKAAADRVIKSWATLLSNALSEVKEGS